MPPSFVLALEVSNPSSGPRGRVERAGVGAVIAGPGVALGEIGGELIGVEPLHEGSRHDDDLMPAIERLCGRCGVRPSELARVAVSIGPGGYTSLRIAVATAKMLAEAAGAQTVAVPSALVAAWSVPVSAAPLLVCLASKGDSTYATLLVPGAGGWGEPLDRAPAGLIEGAALEALNPRTIVADRFLPEGIGRAAARIGAGIVEPVFCAEGLLRVAAGRAAVDPLALAALYPRQPEAVTLWQKRGRG